MNSEFPKIITEERKKRKLSQKQAAADLGISQALLSHYEKGIRECGLDFVVKAANYYNVSCDLLLGHSDGSSEDADAARADIESVSRTAAFLLSACEKHGGQELEKEVMYCIMLNFYKLFRMLGEKSSDDIYRIPKVPAENLADSVIMNICASIKLKSSRSDNTKISISDNFLDLIRASEMKISEFQNICL